MKRKKKVYPPGTFIPTTARVAAILQLCIAFTVFLSIISYPFLGEIFANKSKAILYQDVMGTISISNSVQDQERLQRNAERFDTLPISKKLQLVEEYREIQQHAQTSFIEKIGRSISILPKEVSVFKIAWIVFSIVIPILILLKIDGAVYAAWILPLITLCYAGQNYFMHQNGGITNEERLFPSEIEIAQQYLQKPLSKDILRQQEELKHGWQLYLIEKWAQQEPSKEQSLFDRQVENGEFAFNIARIEAVKLDERSYKDKSEYPVILLIYLIWNTFFAWNVRRAHKPVRVLE